MIGNSEFLDEVSLGASKLSQLRSQKDDDERFYTPPKDRMAESECLEETQYEEPIGRGPPQEQPQEVDLLSSKAEGLQQPNKGPKGKGLYPELDLMNSIKAYDPLMPSKPDQNGPQGQQQLNLMDPDNDQEDIKQKDDHQKNIQDQAPVRVNQWGQNRESPNSPNFDERLDSDQKQGNLSPSDQLEFGKKRSYSSKESVSSEIEEVQYKLPIIQPGDQKRRLDNLQDIEVNKKQSDSNGEVNSVKSEECEFNIPIHIDQHRSEPEVDIGASYKKREDNFIEHGLLVSSLGSRRFQERQLGYQESDSPANPNKYPSLDSEEKKVRPEDDKSKNYIERYNSSPMTTSNIVKKPEPSSESSNSLFKAQDEYNPVQINKKRIESEGELIIGGNVRQLHVKPLSSGSDKSDDEFEQIGGQEPKPKKDDLLSSEMLIQDKNDIYHGGSRHAKAEDHDASKEFEEKIGGGSNPQSMINFNVDPIDDSILYPDIKPQPDPSEEQSEISNFNFELTIPETYTRTENVFQIYYIFKIVFKIQSDEKNAIYEVHRRYSEFVWIQELLKQRNVGHIIPSLPPKNPLTKINQQGDEFQERRRKGLVRFLKKCLTHPHLSTADELKVFLTATKEEFAQYKADEEKQQAKEKNSGFNYLFNSIKKYVYSFSNTPLRERNDEEMNLYNYEVNLSHLHSVLTTIKEQAEQSIKLEEKRITVMGFFIGGMQSILTKDPEYEEPNHLIHKVSRGELSKLNLAYKKQAEEVIKEELDDVIDSIQSCNEAIAGRNTLIEAMFSLEDHIKQKELEVKKDRYSQDNQQQLDSMRRDLKELRTKCETVSNILLRDIERFKRNISMGLSSVFDKLYTMKKKNVEDVYNAFQKALK